MTVEEAADREAIRDLLARYHIAGDRLRAADFAAVFAVDGILESDGAAPADGFRHAGRAAILAWMSGWAQPRDISGERQARFVRHHLSTSQIDFVDGEARGLSYFSAWTDIGPDHAGTYLDRFRKDDGRWRIAHRRVRIDWRADAGLFRREGSGEAAKS